MSRPVVWTSELLALAYARVHIYGVSITQGCFGVPSFRDAYTRGSKSLGIPEYNSNREKYNRLAETIGTLDEFKEYRSSGMDWRELHGSSGLKRPRVVSEAIEAIAAGFSASGLSDGASIQESMANLHQKFCARITEILQHTDETTFVHDNIAISPYIQGVCVLEYLRGSESALKTLRAFMERANPALRDKSSGLTPADYKSYCRDREKQARDIAEQEARETMMEVDRIRAEQAQQDVPPKKVKEG